MNTTNTTAVHDLQQHADSETLTPVLHGLCSHFGAVEKLVVLTAKHEGSKQAICFLRLASEDQEQALMQSLGGEKFGEQVVIVVDLKQSEQDRQRHSKRHCRNDDSRKNMPRQAA